MPKVEADYPSRIDIKRIFVVCFRKVGRLRIDSTRRDAEVDPPIDPNAVSFQAQAKDLHQVCKKLYKKDCCLGCPVAPASKLTDEGVAKYFAEFDS